MNPVPKARQMIEITVGAKAWPPWMTDGIAAIIKIIWEIAPIQTPYQMVFILPNFLSEI